MRTNREKKAERNTKAGRNTRTDQKTGIRMRLTVLALLSALLMGLVTGCGAGPGSEEQGGIDAAGSTGALQEEKETATADMAGQTPQPEDGDISEPDDPAQPPEEGQNLTEDDPTLGGIFELYTAEEYAEVVDNIKKSGAATGEELAFYEESLKRLQADGGKGEFIIYKGAFEVTYEVEGGGTVMEAVNPDVIMRPEQVQRDKPLTAQEYEEIIEQMDAALDDVVAEGRLTGEEKQRILDRMNQNLAQMQ
ncbi:hypothetical protein V1224_11450 [Lachnospiraceae bacterium JLR.KK008]